MILRSNHLLLELLLAICVCGHLAAPLGKKGAKLLRRNLEESTESASPSEPIKVLRSTDHDVIIQVRRLPFKRSRDGGRRNDKSISYHSDESVYNKHVKSKYKSAENHEQVTINDNKGVGKVIVQDRKSRLSLHKLLPFSKLFQSKEFRFKDKNNHRLLDETEQDTPFQEGNGHSNSNPSNFEKDNNKDISDMEVVEAKTEDSGVDFGSSYSNTRLKDLGQIELSDEENKMESTEINVSDKQNIHKGFRPNLSLHDRKNKRELNEESLNVSKPELSRNVIDLKIKRNLHLEGSKEKEDHLIQSANTESNSQKIPKSLKPSLRTISFKRNDIMETQKPEPTTSTKLTTASQDKKNELNDDQSKSLLYQKEPLRNKIIQTRSPSLDSLQDLKRKFKIPLKRPPLLLPKTPVLLARQDAQVPQTYEATPNQEPLPVYAPPSGQYYVPQRPIVVIPTEDPIVQAERTKSALQRMILFVNAMGKFDYYVSNAARNFVDLMTQHTHEYDKTVRSRYSGKDQCGGEKDEQDVDVDGDDDAGGGKDGYVRIRTSKSRKPSTEGGRKHARNREVSNPGSHDYGW